MADESLEYEVLWLEDVVIQLLELEPFIKISPEIVYDQSIILLSKEPKKNGQVVNFPEYEFHDYYWTVIRNVIIVYDVSDDEKVVYIDACYFANTAWALKAFYGEYDPVD